MPSEPIRPAIRWMIRPDMPEVLAIEQEAFEFPWREDDFIRCLRQRNCIGMVAEHEERIVGFIVYELDRTRIHILNFAVAQPFRRRGIGSQMANKLKAKLSSQRRTRITLEVRETNLPAVLFFKAQKFLATNLLRDFYEDTPEDACQMIYRYGAEAAEQQPQGPRQTTKPFRFYFVDLVSGGGPAGVPNAAWRGKMRIGGVLALDKLAAYEAAAAIYPCRPWELFQVTAARSEAQRREVVRLANEFAARQRKFEQLMAAICAGQPLILETER